MFALFRHQGDNMTDITIVSGLPRSGTSVGMQMLTAGGIVPMIDNVRIADEDNPRGYLEYEMVKSLPTNKSWLEDVGDRAVKMVYKLLYELPIDGTYNYKILLLNRNIGEVVISQKKMLRRLGKHQNISDNKLISLLSKELTDVIFWCQQQRCIDMHIVQYQDIIDHPRREAQTISTFLKKDLDIDAMVAAVDPTLHRNKIEYFE